MYNGYYHSFISNGMALYNAALWLLTLVMMINKSNYSFKLTMGLFTLFISCLAIANYHHSFLRVHGVIMKKAAIKSGPATSLETLFYLHDGAEFDVKKEVNNGLR